MKSSRALFALFILCLTGCLSGGGEGGSEPQHISGKPAGTVPYRIEGNHLVILPTLDTVYDCDYDSLVRIVDTLRGTSTAYTLTPSTLTVAATSSLPNSGAVVENLTLLARIGQGAGVQGIWREAGLDYRVVSGNPDAGEKSDLDARLADRRWELSFEENQYEITPDVIRSYIDKQTAAQAMARWRGEGPPGTTSAESSSFAMDARAIDKYTVEYKGRVTGETVRVTTQPNDDADYSSSDTSHHPGHYSNNTTTCPLSGWPDWYENFRIENRKSDAPAPKAMAGYRESPMVPNAGAEASKRKQFWMYP